MREHGTRAKYVAESCRCDDCRRANRDYARERVKLGRELVALLRRRKQLGAVKVVKAVRAKGKKLGQNELREVSVRRACPGFDGRPCVKRTYLRGKDHELCSYCRERIISRHVFVSTKEARDALRRLRARGIGLRTIEMACDIARYQLVRIANGKKKRIAPETEDAILRTLANPPEPRSRWKRQRRPNRIPDVPCEQCGLSHAKEARLHRLRMMLPCTAKEIIEAYFCTYPRTMDKNGAHVDNVSRSADRRLFRDLHDVGARSVNGVWMPAASGPAAPLPSSHSDHVPHTLGHDHQDLSAL